MKIPSIAEIEQNRNNQYQLAVWYRFCQPETYSDSETKALHLILDYFQGFTPELSKAVGWESR